jgi:geranylgeranyl diphosphate synthase type I
MDLSTSTLARPNALFERHLREAVAGPAQVRRYYQMMAYHLGWLDEELAERDGGGGKRLRPSLCLMACESVGAPPEHALPGALAVELVHNASLIHDDIEDGDERRRHRPAVWALWGTAHGVNVGDGMLSLAHLAMLEASTSRGTTVAAMCGAALGRSCVELFEGQFLDQEYQARASVSLPEYLAMADRKTGALFGCAAELGGLLGGADAGVVRRLAQFGRTLGRAFQMQDDLLGVWGEESRTGKPADDVRKRKRGLPAALAWDCASPAAFTELRELYGAAGADERASERVLELFAELDVQRRGRRMIAEEVDAAIEQLPSAGLPDAATLPLLHFAALLSTRSA